MREIFILMATAVPTSQLIDDLKEALFNYEMQETKENKEKLEMHLQLLSINLQTSGKIEKASEMIENCKKVENISNIFGNKN